MLAVVVPPLPGPLRKPFFQGRRAKGRYFSTVCKHRLPHAHLLQTADANHSLVEQLADNDMLVAQRCQDAFAAVCRSG